MRESIDQVEEAIRRRAFELYKQRLDGEGSPGEDWLRAEQEISPNLPVERMDIEGALVTEHPGSDGSIASSGDADVTGIAPTFLKMARDPRHRGPSGPR